MMSICGMCKKPEGNPDCAFCKDKKPSPTNEPKPRTVNASQLQQRNYNDRKASFLPNEEIPFSGLVQDFFPNGQKQHDFTYKNGVKIEGKSWYMNGQISSDLNQSQEVHWHSNGQRAFVKTSTNGLISDCSSWKNDGTKCPYTEFKSGNGILATWCNNAFYATAIKDGKVIDKYNGSLIDFANSYWCNKYRVSSPPAPPDERVFGKYTSIFQFFSGLMILSFLYFKFGIFLDFEQPTTWGILYCIFLLGISWLSSYFLFSPWLPNFIRNFFLPDRRWRLPGEDYPWYRQLAWGRVTIFVLITLTVFYNYFFDL